MRVLVFCAFCLVLIGAVLGVAGSAYARDTVLLLQAETLRPDLCAALRIQLTDVADVRCRTQLGSADLAVRIADAASAVESEPARLAVLLERDPDGKHVRMIIVGAPDDRAVLAIESIEDRPAPDVDRSLALKVRDTLHVIEAQPKPELATVIAPSATSARERVRGLLELGGALGTSGGPRAAGVVSLGLRTWLGRNYGEVALRGQLSAGLETRSQPPRVEEDEWGLALGLRAGRELGRVSLGVLAELEVLRVHARGFTRDGTRGDDTRALVRLGVGLDARVVLLDGPTRMALRFAPTLQVDPQRQTFLLDGQPALDLERVHAWLPLTLVFELPLQQTHGGGDA